MGNVNATAERNKTMWFMRKSGSTFVDIGKKFGVTGSRVRQIVLRTDRRLKHWEKLVLAGLDEDE